MRLWSRNLTEKLEILYAEQARRMVAVFVYADYAIRNWTYADRVAAALADLPLAIGAIPIRVERVLPEPEKVQLRWSPDAEPSEHVERRHAGVGLFPGHNVLPGETGVARGTAGDDREDRTGPLPGQGARTISRAHQCNQTHGPVQG
ncbi:hypothetical protein [Frankia sp. Cj3]|uniref:hypothetical protein n=1 Tax=Frankia sp. Cj3 TaxID=2880976 RepID=UPI001EF487B9|nr:hypothetical protein [Frankia sp. Cj3]